MSDKLSVLDWMDDVLKEYLEFERFAEGVDPEFESLFKLVARWNNNMYPAKADDEGIRRFEELLSITPSASDTLDERRYRVLTKLNAKLPYTEVQLRRILGGILGYDGFTLTVKDLILTISLAEGNNSKLNILVELLKEIVPMNILLVIHQMINNSAKVTAGCVWGIGEQVTVLPLNSNG